jgi:hypothetical protein
MQREKKTISRYCPFKARAPSHDQNYCAQVMLAESPKYTGLRLDEAPRNMGDGFVVLASNVVSIYYYMDEVALFVFVFIEPF